MLSISVDPALTLNLFRVLGVLLCIAVSGLLLVYFAFSLRSLSSAFATAFPIGSAGTLLVSNLLAYALGTPRALTLGLLAMLAIASTIALVRRKSYMPPLPLSWIDGGLIIGACIAIFILSVVNYVIAPVWEYSTHFWLANTIRFGNFPVMAPGSPLLLAEYHYGGAFLAAVIAHIGNVDSAISFLILTPLAATTAFLAASVVAASVLKNIRLGLLAGLFFSFSDGLSFLIDPIRLIYLRWFPPSSAAAGNLLADTFETIAPSSFEGQYPRYLFDSHFLLAGAILLSVIVLIIHLDSPERGSGNSRAPWYQWVFLGVLFASVALIESLVFALGFIGWGWYVLWRTISQRKLFCFYNYVFAAAPAALLATFQGGILTSTLFSSAPGGTGLSTAFDLSFKPLPFALGHPLQQFAYPTPWIAIYLILFGLPLVAAPGLLIWAHRSRHAMPLVWLAAIGTFGLLVPHVVIYHFNTFLRWLSLGHTILAFLLGIGALTLVSQLRSRWMAWTLFLACAALTVGWPLATSVKNVAVERSVALGQSIEDNWTISALHRQSDHIDWVTGRPYTFLMGAEAREFLRSLPANAKVLTNRFPEVPLLIRGLAPHKNTDVFSYTYFRYPSPTYFDALYALDPTAMQTYQITHIVINHKWFLGTSSYTHALLQDPRFFSLIFTDEDMHGGFAWHHVYEVLPAFYEQKPYTSQDLVRDLAQHIPQEASVYVSPAIPKDIRWALLYVLRDRRLASSPSYDNHIDTRLNVAEPRPNDQYDYALLVDEPLGERWLNWAYSPQDLPATWGLSPSVRIWHALGVGLYAVGERDCFKRTFASVPASRHIPARTPVALNLDCTAASGTNDRRPSSLLVTVLSPDAAVIEIDADGIGGSFSVEPGATLIPLDAPNTRQLTLHATEEIWVRVQRLPEGIEQPRSGIPALQIIPTYDSGELSVDVRFYGHRTAPPENQVVWELIKQRRIYGHWWHWDSPNQAGVWRLMLPESPDHGSRFSFQMDFSSLAPRFTVNEETAHPPRDVDLPRNPGEPYVLYFTMFRPGAKAQSMPVAWLTYGPEEESTVVLAPRFILLDQAATQN